MSGGKEKKPNLRTTQKSRPCISRLGFEGKGVRVKSVVPFRGANISPQHKTKNVNIVFWENGMNAAPDTDKHTNLIYKYILYISALNHGPISANWHV